MGMGAVVGGCSVSMVRWFALVRFRIPIDIVMMVRCRAGEPVAGGIEGRLVMDVPIEQQAEPRFQRRQEGTDHDSRHEGAE
jgi:hypothetical protein